MSSSMPLVQVLAELQEWTVATHFWHDGIASAIFDVSKGHLGGFVLAHANLWMVDV